MAVADPEILMDVVHSLSAEGEDADAALARLFQEQEHAWFLANGGRSSEFGIAAEDDEASGDDQHASTPQADGEHDGTDSHHECAIRRP
jgi:hypothetical protein